MPKTTYLAITAPPAHPRPPLIRGKRRDTMAAVRWPPPTVIAPPTHAAGGWAERLYTRFESVCTLEKHARNRAETGPKQRPNNAKIWRGARKERTQSRVEQAGRRAGIDWRTVASRTAIDQIIGVDTLENETRQADWRGIGTIGPTLDIEGRRRAALSAMVSTESHDRATGQTIIDRAGIGRQCTARGHTRPTEAR